jgi:hypothetical protein
VPVSFSITPFDDPILPEPENYKRNWVGMCVSFDLHRKSGETTREQGEITAQRYLGVTKRGRIPEYEVTIMGKSGKSVLARITRDFIQPLSR